MPNEVLLSVWFFFFLEGSCASAPLFTDKLYYMATGGPASILVGEPPSCHFGVFSLGVGCHLPWAVSSCRLFGDVQGKEEPLLVSAHVNMQTSLLLTSFTVFTAIH